MTEIKIIAIIIMAVVVALGIFKGTRKEISHFSRLDLSLFLFISLILALIIEDRW